MMLVSCRTQSVMHIGGKHECVYIRQSFVSYSMMYTTSKYMNTLSCSNHLNNPQALYEHMCTINIDILIVF